MGAQFLYARVPHLDTLPISFSSFGDNIVVPGISGRRINVHRIWIMFSGSVGMIFKAGTTELSGTLSMFEGGTFALDITGEPWFSTGVGEDFIINLDVDMRVNGMIYYMAAHQ